MIKILDPKSELKQREATKTKNKQKNKIAELKTKTNTSERIQLSIKGKTYYYGYWKSNNQHKIKLVREWLRSLPPEERISYSRPEWKELSKTGYKMLLLHKAGWVL